MDAARVLVVDDEELFLNVAIRVLRRAGYEVHGAALASKALDLIQNGSRFDVVLSDVIMPEMLGTDLIREIARISPQTVRVLITAYVTDSVEVPDAVPLLKKPLSAEDLISAVESALAQSGRAKTNIQPEAEAKF